MDQIDLNGSWGLGWSDGTRKIAARPLLDATDGPFLATATVPGEVHLDLIAAGLLDEPNLGLTTARSRWVDDTVWWYHRDVVVPPELAGRRVWLHFGQLDLVARVFVNGRPAGEHANAFRPFRTEVTELIHEGENHLAVELQARHGGIDKAAILTGKDDDWNRHKRPWHRKPSYQWGWDWSSRYLNVGIGGDARLVVAHSDLLVGRAVPLADVDADLATGIVRARVELENVGTDPIGATIRAGVAGVTGRADVEVAPGEGVYEVVLTVEHPELWWPNGQGPQTLHDLDVEVEWDGRVERRCSVIGFRRIEIDQSPHPGGGRYFTVVVNNRPVFCKGANIAPLDSIPHRIDRARYERLIELAVESNFTFFRVNGVGLYESDDFYELCDRAGILVWQDFTFACSWYPAEDRAFLEDVRAEATWQVRRLASHPSLAIWCGQNESEWMQRTPDAGADPLPDYHVFHLLLPSVLEAEDPSRYYAPCSPHSPGTTAYPNDDHVGTQHPWHIGMGNWDIRDYRQSPARFAAEGGVLGPTSLPTLREIVEDHDHPQASIGWHTHDNWIAQPGDTRPAIPDEMLLQVMGVSSADLDVEQYAYWGGLLQSEGLREYVENYRRRRPDSGAAVFWAFNDSWPTTRSWTTVDYYQRRTPGFWAVRRAMAPVSVVVARTGDVVEVFGVNDTPADVTGELEYGFFRTDGPGSARTATVTLPANSSAVVATLGPWEGDPVSSVAFAALRRDGELDARSRLILPLHRELDWAPAGEPKVVLGDGVATFQSDVFVLGVCLDLDGDRALADNMFDLWPGMPYSIPWPFADAPRILHTGNPRS
ncbi:beta-mannosidase [Jiangella anatolica]|nr:sugar-binding domain-containing protein [Jiangella anatolica]